eukprot:TRINITY_DN1271_c0_g1_i1.p1 TRINITY_DN1271_c0_g1~~TRINITY_DN1271_c0_g1_i1.p1  ORF type:complete len:356 (+),score=107.12 TRINITY_DN1271_c0_g1_i1:105-1172(+)
MSSLSCCKTQDLDKNAVNANKTIEDSLRKDKKKGLPFRLLLLGAGESGKSTIAKQMKILHLAGFSSEEKNLFVSAIHTNIYQSMRSLTQAAERYGFDVEPEIGDAFEAPYLKNPILSPEFGEYIRTLWKDPGIQRAYNKRNEFQLNDSTHYYMNALDRICEEGYEPNDQDVLRSRVQTTGIIETEFQVDGHEFILVDVGGQRSERKKWMHCFEDVTACLFVVGISEFDQVLYEDNVTNRMHEALKLFHEVCQSKWFTDTAMILFLNKSDLFKAKLKQGKNIQVAFPDYKGANTYQDTSKFLQRKFCDVTDPLTGMQKNVFPHLTCATDTGNVRVVFDAVKEFILGQAIDNSGFMI